MVQKYPKVENSIIKIVGLLEEKPGIQNTLETNGYYREKLLPDSSTFLKDYFYPDFRNLMFFSHSNVNNRRYKKEINQVVSLSNSSGTEKLLVKDAEVFLFGSEFIALFCILIQPENSEPTIENISAILNLIRQFDTLLENETKWCYWIENELLGGIKIRGRGVSVDEYSGSKFKLFSIVDLSKEIDDNNRMKLLYDLGTSSPLGSSSDVKTKFSPHSDYYFTIMENKLSVFNNWEALSLLDTFTVVGHNILNDLKQYNTWDYTYFRIYLFRIFFKYNLYRYNSLMSYKDNIVTLRSKYEEFLNIFNIFPVSYNFLPNELFQNIGKGLNIELELQDLHNRITRITETIKERKQEQMNLLLGLISVLSAVASAAAIPTIIEQMDEISGIPAIIYYVFLTLIFIILCIIILRFLKPGEKLKSIFNFWKKSG